MEKIFDATPSKSADTTALTQEPFELSEHNEGTIFPDYDAEETAEALKSQGLRVGEWMHTSLGGKFYPADPRPEEIFISDIANGLSLDCRYAGQGSVYNFYSVAEHSVLMAEYAERQGWEPKLCLAVLLHDAAEAYLNDLPRPVKAEMKEFDCYGCYETLEDKIGWLIHTKYNTHVEMMDKRVKDLDNRMVSHEKAKLMRYQQPWPGTDELEPLEGVQIKCWSPPYAKQKFLETYDRLTLAAGLPQEEWEI